MDHNTCNSMGAVLCVVRLVYWRRHKTKISLFMVPLCLTTSKYSSQLARGDQGGFRHHLSVHT